MQELEMDSLLGDKYPYACFHDFHIFSVFLDYKAHEAKLECNLHIYGPKDSDDDPERKRQGTLYLKGLLYFVIEPPDAGPSFEDTKGIGVTGGGSVNGTQFKAPLPNLPVLHETDAKDAFVHWLYVHTWNSFIFFAAKEAYFEWK